MIKSPEDIKESAKRLTFDDDGPHDDPLTDRRMDPTDPKSKIHLRICIDPNITRAQWGEIAQDFKKPSEDMIQQIRWAWEDIVNHSRLKDHIEVEYVTGSEKADITYFSAKPGEKTPMNELWPEITAGYKNDQGRVCKEVLLNPDPTESVVRGNPRFEAWKHFELYNEPNALYNPRNRYGQAARIVKHGTGHALGLDHWDYKGVGDIRVAGAHQDVNTDVTIMAYLLGKNTKYDYRPLDWEALASIYVPQPQTIRERLGAIPMSAHNKSDRTQRSGR